MTGPDSPEEQLAAIAGARQRLAAVQRRAASIQAALCVVLGVLMGAMHLVVTVFRPDRSPLAFFIGMATIVVVVLGVFLGYLRVRTAVPAGAGRRYLVGFVLSMVLYQIALIPAIAMGESLLVAVAIAVVIAAPLVVTGLLALGRGTRS